MTVRKRGYYLAVFATLLAVVVVVLGAYTRLVHAGLGCPDWPGCYGQLTVPETAREIARAETLFPDAPVEVDKGWAEMIHRYVAGLLLLVVLGLAFIAWRHRKEPGQPVKLPFFILALIILQAAFGMWTVTLKLWPQVVTLHLLGGFATLSLLFLLSLRLSGHCWEKLPRDVVKRVSGLGLLGLFVVVIQVALGGWISSNYAALACHDFPMCQGQWLPETDFAQGFDFTQEIGPNYLGGQMDSAARTAIHLTHRIGALITVLLLLLLYIGTKKQSLKLTYSLRSRLRRNANIMMSILAVQVALGVSNIVWQIPLPVAVAHNLFGALLLLSLVALNYQFHISGDE